MCWASWCLVAAASSFARVATTRGTCPRPATHECQPGQWRDEPVVAWMPSGAQARAFSRLGQHLSQDVPVLRVAFEVEPVVLGLAEIQRPQPGE
jgi:hypothetical protein